MKEENVRTRITSFSIFSIIASVVIECCIEILTYFYVVVILKLSIYHIVVQNSND